MSNTDREETNSSPRRTEYRSEHSERRPAEKSIQCLRKSRITANLPPSAWGPTAIHGWPAPGHCEPPASTRRPETLLLGVGSLLKLLLAPGSYVILFHDAFDCFVVDLLPLGFEFTQDSRRAIRAPRLLMYATDFSKQLPAI